MSEDIAEDMADVEDIELKQTVPDMDEEFMEDNDNGFETKIVIKERISSSDQTIVNDITDEELYSVYQSFDINFDELNRKFSNWRLNVIHIRGVQEMSSEDVLDYFRKYDPNSIEWVNDLSCNIIFNNEKSSAVAMTALTNTLVIKLSKESVSLDLGIKVIDADSLSVPVPPGLRWRLGLTHPKSKALLLRFATISDKKIRGSRNMSQYYEKYGLNDSIQQNLFRNQRKRYLREDFNEIHFNDSTRIDNKSKRLRMRMRADDEQDIIQNRRKISEKRLILPLEHKPQINDRKSIWDRLDNDSLGNYCAVDTHLLQIACNNETNSREFIWKDKASSLRSSISIVKPKKNVLFNKNDLRSRLGKRKSY